jgi:hypothetical protein
LALPQGVNGVRSKGRPPSARIRAIERADHAFACKEAFMAFTGIYKPPELALICKVLDDASAAIERSSLDHRDASYLVLSLFEKGAQTVEELKTALDAALAGAPSGDRSNPRPLPAPSAAE